MSPSTFDIHDIIVIGSVILTAVFNWARMEAGMKTMKDRMSDYLKALDDHRGDDNRNFEGVRVDIRGVHTRIDTLRDQP